MLRNSVTNMRLRLGVKMQITQFARFAQNYALLLSEMKDDKKWREFRKRWLARFVAIQ